MLAPPGRAERRLAAAAAARRGSDLEAVIQQLVRHGIQTVPAEEGILNERVVAESNAS